MTTLLQQPPFFHTAYNPVLFTLSGNELSATLRLESGGRAIPIEVDFLDEKATIDLQGILKSLFTEIDYTPGVVNADNFQSIVYSLYHITNNQAVLLAGPFTAIRAAVQAGNKHDLTSQRGKLLTGFKKLYTYDGYPADVSNLSVGGQWKGMALTPERINRLPINCHTDNPVEPFYELSCGGNWNPEKYVCNQTNRKYSIIAHAISGDGLGSGTVSPEFQEVEAGESVSVITSADSSPVFSRFSHWQNNEGVIISDNSILIIENIQSNHEVYAVFVKTIQDNKITIDSSGGGGINAHAQYPVASNLFIDVIVELESGEITNIPAHIPFGEQHGRGGSPEPIKNIIEAYVSPYEDDTYKYPPEIMK